MGRPDSDGQRRFSGFSLAKLRNIKEEGVTFQSHGWPENFHGAGGVHAIQANLGSDIAMAFDECVENPATHAYAKLSQERTLRWLERCIEVRKVLMQEPDCVNPQQMLFGINQGVRFRTCASGMQKRSRSCPVTDLPLAAWR